MRDRTPEFLYAEDHVKVSHFTRQGFDIEGVVHVGANDGYEIEFYLKLGSPDVMAFEPLYAAYRELRRKYGTDPRVHILPFALGEESSERVLNITPGDGQGSSFLKEIGPVEIVGQQNAPIRRFDSFKIDLKVYNTLVVDVQGMELPVLKGFGERLKEFDFLNIECSRVPIYDGEVPATAVIEFLDSQGFRQDSPIEDHNDIMFINKRVRVQNLD